MTFRSFATSAALAIAGVAAAVGIGLLANTISGSSVGLGAEPLSAGETLVPATTKADNRARDRRERERRRNRNRGEDADTVEVPTATDPTVTTFDDHGGEDSSGSSSGGSDDSGSN